jgi:hypothetical protein
MSDLKILVCYHKDCDLLPPYLNHDVYVNVHGGRKLYKGDSKFLLSLQGDDNGENISDLNPIFNELTVVYWGWKNLDKIGNPNYVGLNHYRRMFAPSTIEDYHDYDMMIWGNILTKGKIANITLRQQFEHHHGKRPLENLFKYIDEEKQDYSYIKEYFEKQTFYSKNMFIMKRNVFEEYCNLLFPFLFGMMKYFDGNENFRDRSFVAERISSILFERLSVKYKTKFLDIPIQYI